MRGRSLPKDDLLRAYAASENVPNGGPNGATDTFLYLAWVRSVSNGDAHIDFELNQHPTVGWTASTPPGPITINRTVGDLLLSYDFGGSGTPDITSFIWLGAAGWGQEQDLSAGGFAEAAVNTTSFTDPLNNNATVGAGTFGEASINLSKIPQLVPPDTCLSFGSMFAKTRSSGSGGQSTVKDYIAPVPIFLSNCGRITIHKDVPGTSPATFSFTGSGADPSVATASPFTLSDDGVAGHDTKTFDPIEPGQYVFNETSLPPFWTLNNPAVTCTTTGSGTTAPRIADDRAAHRHAG